MRTSIGQRRTTVSVATRSQLARLLTEHPYLKILLRRQLRETVLSFTLANHYLIERSGEGYLTNGDNTAYCNSVILTHYIIQERKHKQFGENGTDDNLTRKENK